MVREDISLLEALREELGVRSVKDGCSPQGQCGCCTVLVDGAARVSCVTPVRRVAGRAVTTVDGIPPERQEPLVASFVAHGASQCGFCTPGIVCRLAALPGSPPTPAAVENALLAHLCRCTGWRSIVDAAVSATPAWLPRADAAGAAAVRPPVATGSAGVATGSAGVATGSAGVTAASLPPPSQTGPCTAAATTPASERATLEGGVAQSTGAAVVLGRGGFADDTAPADCLVALPVAGATPRSLSTVEGWSVGATLAEARAGAGKIQGRRSGQPLPYPVEPPPGEWDLTLQTTWVEPAYLEPDASWCEPGGVPASTVANGGAFGAKLESLVPAAARMLADHHGRPVRALYSREDAVRLGPKRPPVGAGIRLDGRGVLRLGLPAGRLDDQATVERFRARVADAAPGLQMDVVPVAGPAVSDRIRAAGWAEAAVLSAVAAAVAAGERVVTVVTGDGARVSAGVETDTTGWPAAVHLRIDAGSPLDETVLCSYAQGAAHMALGWVCSEGIAVDEHGEPTDLTIRSFGVLRAKDTPVFDVELAPGAGGPPRRASDAVFAAVAGAAWLAQGLPSRWPTRRGAQR